MKLIHWIDLRNGSNGTAITDLTTFEWLMYQLINGSRTTSIVYCHDISIEEYRKWTGHGFPTLMRKEMFNDH